MYQLIFKSKLPIAEDFQQWVFEDVLPSIHKTGTCTVPTERPLIGQQIRLINETDLHYKVVDFIRKFYPDAIIIAGLGENQDTYEKRIDSSKKGYLKGQPDILIVSPHSGYTGFAIELKTPKGWGLLSNTQKGVLTRLEVQKFKTLVSKL